MYELRLQVRLPLVSARSAHTIIVSLPQLSLAPTLITVASLPSHVTCVAAPSLSLLTVKHRCVATLSR